MIDNTDSMRVSVHDSISNRCGSVKLMVGVGRRLPHAETQVSTMPYSTVIQLGVLPLLGRNFREYCAKGASDARIPETTMSAPDLKVEIIVLDVTDYLSSDLAAWATRTRFNARVVEREGVVVITAKDTSGVVGYAVFDTLMAHLHYFETREDYSKRLTGDSS